MSLPDVKLSQKDITSVADNGYMYIILPSGSSWVSKRILIDDLAKYFNTSNKLVNSFQNSDLDDSHVLTVNIPDSEVFEINIQKPDGNIFLANGIAKRMSSTQIKIFFGDTIDSGVWYYVITYYKL